MSQTASATLPVLHEDLSDELAMVLAPKTVYTSTVKAGKPATHSKYGAPADKPQTGRLGGKGESRSVDRSAVVNRFLNRGKIEGIVQETQEDYGLTDRARKVEDPAGVADLAAEADLRAQEALKLDMELTNLSQQVQNEAAAIYNEKGVLETQYLTQGSSAWANSSPLGAVPMPAAFRPAAALNVEVDTLSAWNELGLRNLMKAKWDALNGQDCDTIAFCTSDFQLLTDAMFDLAAITTTSTAIRSFKFEGGAADFEMGLKSYKTNFGKVAFVPTTQLNATRNAPVVSGGAALTGTTTNTSATVVVSSALGLQPYQLIAGAGIPAGAYIVTITDLTHIVISAAATASASVSLTIGDFDHALFLEMEYFQKKLNGGIENHDLSPDGSGTQGYIKAFHSNFCALGTPQARVYTKNS